MVLRRSNSGFTLALVCSCALWAQSQDTGRAVRHHPVPVPESSQASSLLDKAEALLGKGDYEGAKPLLQQATEKDAKSYQAWYDLGYANQALNQRDEAMSAYRRSIDINPKVFESNRNLGLLLARAGQDQEAITYLKTATIRQPSSRAEQAREGVWLALGHLQSGHDPGAAERAYKEAVKLQPSDPQPHLLLAALYETSGNLESSRAEYQQALSAAQGEERALALHGLVNVAIASKQYGEAEANVRQYLAAAPGDSQAHLLLGRLLAAEGNNDDALAELNAAGSQNDAAVLREKAELLSAVGRQGEAAPIYKSLVDQNGNDAQLRYEYGIALMHQQQWPASQEQLMLAVKLRPNLASAYGDLAVVASENKQYDLTLKALEIRTKLLGDNPGTFFLRATALDHLRRYPEATENYRQFLAVANGKYPDEEWKARHRLVAIEKLK